MDQIQAHISWKYIHNYS